jgi:hypothetical protein
MQSFLDDVLPEDTEESDTLEYCRVSLRAIRSLLLVAKTHLETILGARCALDLTKDCAWEKAFGLSDDSKKRTRQALVELASRKPALRGVEDAMLLQTYRMVLLAELSAPRLEMALDTLGKCVPFVPGAHARLLYEESEKKDIIRPLAACVPVSPALFDTLTGQVVFPALVVMVEGRPYDAPFPNL